MGTLVLVTLPTFEAGKQIPTREASKEVLSAVADLVPGLILGSGDLTGNTGMAVAAIVLCQHSFRYRSFRSTGRR